MKYTSTLEMSIQVVTDGVKDFEIGVTGVLGKLFTGIVEPSEEGGYLLWGYGIQLLVRKIVCQFGQEYAAGSDRIFMGVHLVVIQQQVDGLGNFHTHLYFEGIG